jgi:hypothetical protein
MALSAEWKSDALCFHNSGVGQSLENLWRGQHELTQTFIKESGIAERNQPGSFQ